MEILLFAAIFGLIGLGVYLSRKLRSNAFYKKNRVCPQCNEPLVKTNVALYNGDNDFSIGQFGRETRHDSNQRIPALRCPKCDYKIALDRY